MTMQTTSSPLFDTRRMEYETPRGGISIGEYIARRLHKTELLKPVASLLATDTANALAQIALYAMAGSTSFGPALYQPDGNARGEMIETTDPATGAHVRVICSGYNAFGYVITYQGVGKLTGQEQITGTTVGLRGLGMPAPSTFEFKAADETYTASLQGIITAELVPGIRSWRIRGYGKLNLRDSAGNHGTLMLERSGALEIEITTANGERIKRGAQLAG